MTDDRVPSAEISGSGRRLVAGRRGGWWIVAVWALVLGTGVACAGALTILLSDSWATYEERLARLERIGPSKTTAETPAEGVEEKLARLDQPQATENGAAASRLESDMAQIRQSLAQVQNQMMQWGDSLRQRGYDEQNTQGILFALALGQARWSLDAGQMEFYRLALKNLKDSLPSSLTEDDRHAVERLLTLNPLPLAQMQQSFLKARQALVPPPETAKASPPPTGWWARLAEALRSVVTVTHLGEAPAAAPVDPRLKTADEMELHLIAGRWDEAIQASESLADQPDFSDLRRQLRERMEAEALLLRVARSVQSLPGHESGQAPKAAAP
ncbi:MAG: hypothetical protein IPI58_09580 [Alphaproteobacteria bacterium]|nr:MAG: hypothetical protein IPI58_09580 [Alphaproteobacteria bacterium]